MPWSNIERALRMAWTGQLLCHLLALAIQFLLAAANLNEDAGIGYPTYSPVWEAERFQSPEAYFYRRGVTAGYWLFSIAGLWIRQRSPWLNWAWTLPWLGATAIGWFTGDWPVWTPMDY